MKSFQHVAIALCLAAAASLACAQDHAHRAQPAASPQLPMSDGEVKKIDKDAGKITLRHGELKNLNMGAMTMVFRVKELAMLDQVKVGDKIQFSAERVNGALTVLALQAAQ